MAGRIEQWTRYLAIGDDTRATLNACFDLILPNIDELMDEVYHYILAHDTLHGLFADQATLDKARHHQKQHWLQYVLKGNFSGEYWLAARAIGRTHYYLGITLPYYMGAYAVMQAGLTRLLTQQLHNEADRLSVYLSVLQRAIYLDMGIATSVYYDTAHAELEEMAQELNYALARAGEFRDNETGKHIIRMSRMCKALALAIGQDEKWAAMILIASPLHDVGKIGIPDHILLKPGRLTDEEMDIMRQHPNIGAAIIPEHRSDLIRMAKRIALTHHERWDGTGYPSGLYGEEIPLEGRIASICDVYDALISYRPYKPAWSQHEALAFLLENSGKLFEPRLVDAFIDILPEINAIQAEFADVSQTNTTYTKKHMIMN